MAHSKEAIGECIKNVDALIIAENIFFLNCLKKNEPNLHNLKEFCVVYAINLNLQVYTHLSKLVVDFF